MTDAPERIWANVAVWGNGKPLAGEWNHRDVGLTDDTPFIRADLAPDPALFAELVEALHGAIGALEFSRDYHADLGNEEQAFAQDKLDAALAVLAKIGGDA